MREHTRGLGGTPSQLGYKGFPKSLCTSVAPLSGGRCASTPAARNIAGTYQKSMLVKIDSQRLREEIAVAINDMEKLGQPKA